VWQYVVPVISFEKERIFALTIYSSSPNLNIKLNGKEDFIIWCLHIKATYGSNITSFETASRLKEVGLLWINPTSTSLSSRIADIKEPQGLPIPNGQVSSSKIVRVDWIWKGERWHVKGRCWNRTCGGTNKILKLLSAFLHQKILCHLWNFAGFLLAWSLAKLKEVFAKWLLLLY